MPEKITTQVAIIGAGPAGLSAASAAANAGCQVALLDTYARPGGQYYRQLAQGLTSHRPGALHHEYATGARLFQNLEAYPEITLYSGANVWAAESVQGNFVLQVDQTLYSENSSEKKALEITAQVVILAPGAYDRALAFPGWDLPGVMTVGGIQALLKSYRVRPGQRVALSGSGPFLLPVAALLAQSGAEVVGVFEATHPRHWLTSAHRSISHLDKMTEGAGYMSTIRKQRIPYKYGRAVIRAEGSERVERITVARLDADWKPLEGRNEELEVDALGIGYGFMPNTELTYALGCAHRYDHSQAAFFATHKHDMQSSQPGVYVAGEITGIAGSAVALQQGSIAGWAAAGQLGKVSQKVVEDKTDKARRELKHQKAFAETLNRLFTLRPGRFRWMTSETILCRCEEVTAGKVREAVREAKAQDVRSVKLQTRCGMGLCQGRVCGHLVTGLVADLTGRDPAEVGTFTTRPIVRPLPLGQIAGKGE
ncbi:MAG TPA: NAD(P)/FAD-dependent oxidoreductase [Chloroflexia bacterium]|nr:NAD(P)/FAD-dependent oxidoreductase [Chloroflexia bacterium]